MGGLLMLLDFLAKVKYELTMSVLVSNACFHNHYIYLQGSCWVLDVMWFPWMNSIEVVAGFC